MKKSLLLVVMTLVTGSAFAQPQTTATTTTAVTTTSAPVLSVPTPMPPPAAAAMGTAPATTVTTTTTTAVPAAPATAIPTPPAAAMPSAPAAAMPGAAATPPANDWMAYHDPYVGEQNNLANPNRTAAEISAWTGKTVASALSFTPEDFNTKVAAAKVMFTAQGWTEYQSYLAQSQLAERVRDQHMILSTILNGDPVMLGSEAVGGSYRWLVRTPIMITFFTKDPKTGMQMPAGNGKFKLTLQIGRVAKTASAEGIAIESWKIEASDVK